MKKSLVLLALVVVLSMLLGACGKKADVYTVATDATFPPFEMMDDDKNLIGFDIELMDMVAEEAGITIEWKNAGFDSILAGMTTCQYDLAASAITITEERAETMGFSSPYINAGQAVVVNASVTDINGYEDLSGKVIGGQLGTTGLMEAEKVEGATLKTYDSYELAFQDVINGQADAIIIDYPTAKAYVGINEGKLKVVGEPFTEEYYGFAICKSDTELIEKVNTALASLKDNGKLADLEDKWLAGE
ncbi:MAG: basic amino acid ABC transporter substrate-binding protein [Anaerolineaceae bacterium]|nr:basic amino acid ABC transporter substrate-binding protein [Anaerolineaceae bacterium]